MGKTISSDILFYYSGLYVFISGGFTPRYGRDYFNFEYFLLGLTYLCILGVTSFLGSLKNSPTQKDKSISVKSNPLFMDFLAAVTVMAYLIWFWDIIKNPELFTRVIVGLYLNVRQEISTIPGLTTLTQLGVVYAIFFACYKWVWKKELKLRYYIYLYTLILLGIIRTIAWSERLATIEVVLPMALIYFYNYHGKNRIKRFINLTGPYLGIFFILIFFGIFEFIRSWGKQQVNADSLISFMIDRFGYYYYSSMNNGAGLLTEFPWPNFDGQFTMKWIYTFPILSDYLPSYTDHGRKFLTYFADVEFTTYSGFFPVFYDIGIVGGLIYASIYGFIIGFCYRKFKEGIGFGLLMYPILFTSLAELLRILYMSYSRIIPIIIFMIIGYKLIKQQGDDMKVKHE